MNVFTEEDIDFIYQDIKQKGIYTEMLSDEMVDHICCSIEDDIAGGLPFKTAYNRLMSSIGTTTLEKLQYRTNLSVNLKFQMMKKLMFILGFMGTILLIAGVIFKINHFPGASMGMFLGAVLIVFGFLPLFFITTFKEQKENNNVVLSVLGYITLAFLIIGPLFKILHWPYADKLLYFGPLLLTVFFLPVYLVQVFRKANATKTNAVYILLIVAVGFSSFFMLSSINLSGDVVEKYDSIYQKNLQVIDMFADRNDSLEHVFLHDSSYISKQHQIKEIKSASEMINSHINSLMISMIIKANSDDATLSDFENKTDKQACKDVMHSNDNGAKLKTLLENYKFVLQAYVTDEFQKEKLANLLSYDVSDYNINFLVYKRAVLIDALIVLSDVMKNAEIAEYEVLQTL